MDFVSLFLVKRKFVLECVMRIHFKGWLPMKFIVKIPKILFSLVESHTHNCSRAIRTNIRAGFGFCVQPSVATDRFGFNSVDDNIFGLNTRRAHSGNAWNEQWSGRNRDLEYSRIQVIPANQIHSISWLSHEIPSSYVLSSFFGINNARAHVIPFNLILVCADSEFIVSTVGVWIPFICDRSIIPVETCETHLSRCVFSPTLFSLVNRR